jgi:hypothetical protein
MIAAKICHVDRETFHAHRGDWAHARLIAVNRGELRKPRILDRGAGKFRKVCGIKSGWRWHTRMRAAWEKKSKVRT